MIWGVLQFPGSCDERDALHACEIAGGEARLIWHEDRDLGGVDGVVVPGGFSYGDYLRAGRSPASRRRWRRSPSSPPAGGPVLGICNGFQVLCEAGLLPGALLRNAEPALHLPPGRAVESSAVDGPKAGLAATSARRRLSIPVKHGEGRYYAPEEMLDSLEANGQVAYRYADGHNPTARPATSPASATRRGNVVGLMPHPEHAVDPLTGSTDGLRRLRRVAERFAA